MASKHVQELNELNFDELVLRAPGPVLVDFTATWCPPCKALSPIVERLAAQLPHVTVGAVDCDEYPALAARFAVRGMPTLVVFEYGQESARRVGFTSEAGVLSLLGPEVTQSAAG